MRTHLILLSPASILLAWAAPIAAAPQDFTALVLEGDAVAGVGNVTRIDAVAVNRSGDWLVEADTDHSDGDADQVVVNSTGLAYREGQTLTAPVGATLDSFDSVGLTDTGETAWNLFLDGTSGLSDDSGLFLDDQLLVQEGDVMIAAQVSAGTTWIGFFEARMNSFHRLITLASIDDPAIASSVDRAFVRFDLDAGGSTLVISRRGQPVARIERVPFLGRRMKAIERLLGVQQVKTLGREQ